MNFKTCSLYLLIISALLFSCKADYKKDIVGVWWLDKVDTMRNVQIAGNELDTMYYEFKNNNSEQYTSSLGLFGTSNYSLKDNTLNCITFMKTALDASKVTLKSDRKYEIIKLNQTEFILKSENQEEADYGTKYYFKRADTAVLEHLKKMRQNYTDLQEAAKFNQFKEGFVDDPRASKVSMATYDEFLHCVYDKLYKQLNERELLLLQEGKTNSDTLLRRRIKDIDKGCVETFLKPNQLY